MGNPTLNQVSIDALNNAFKATNIVTNIQPLINAINSTPLLVDAINYGTSTSVLNTNGQAVDPGVTFQVQTGVPLIQAGALFAPPSGSSSGTVNLSITGSSSTISSNDVQLLIWTLAHEFGHVIDYYYSNGPLYQSGQNSLGVVVNGVDAEQLGNAYSIAVWAQYAAANNLSGIAPPSTSVLTLPTSILSQIDAATNLTTNDGNPQLPPVITLDRQSLGSAYSFLAIQNTYQNYYSTPAQMNMPHPIDLDTVLAQLSIPLSSFASVTGTITADGPVETITTKDGSQFTISAPTGNNFLGMQEYDWTKIDSQGALTAGIGWFDNVYPTSGAVAPLAPSSNPLLPAATGTFSTGTPWEFYLDPGTLAGTLASGGQQAIVPDFNFPSIHFTGTSVAASSATPDDGTIASTSLDPQGDIITEQLNEQELQRVQSINTASSNNQSTYTSNTDSLTVKTGSASGPSVTSNQGGTSTTWNFYDPQSIQHLDLSGIGATFGSALGGSIGGALGHNSFENAVYSAVFSTIGKDLGQTAALAFKGRANLDLASDFQTGFKHFFGDLGASGVSSLADIGIGDLIQLAGISGPGGALIDSLASAVVNTLIANAFNGVTNEFQNLGTSIETAGLSWAGDELASLVIQPTTLGGSIGSSIGSAVGTYILPGIGTFIGDVIGTAIGDLFGEPASPQAWVRISEMTGTSQAFQSYFLGSKDNGPVADVINIGNVLATELNSIVASTGGVVAPSSPIQSFNFGIRQGTPEVDGFGNNLLLGGAGNDVITAEGVSTANGALPITFYNDMMTGGGGTDTYIVMPGTIDTINNTGNAGAAGTIELTGVASFSQVDAHAYAGTVSALAGSLEIDVLAPSTTGTSNTSGFSIATPSTDVIEQVYVQNYITNAAGRVQYLQLSNGTRFDISNIGANFIQGTPANNFLEGTQGNDSIFGNGGTDTIEAFGGSDFVVGDGLLSGGLGNDTILGGNANDTIWGGPGSNNLDGGGGSNFILGAAFDPNGSDVNTIHGGAAGTTGTNTVIGGPDGNLIEYGSGDGAEMLYASLAASAWHTVWTSTGGWYQSGSDTSVEFGRDTTNDAWSGDITLTMQGAKDFKLPQGTVIFYASQTTLPGGTVIAANTMNGLVDVEDNYAAISNTGAGKGAAESQIYWQPTLTSASNTRTVLQFGPSINQSELVFLHPAGSNDLLVGINDGNTNPNATPGSFAGYADQIDIRNYFAPGGGQIGTISFLSAGNVATSILLQNITILGATADNSNPQTISAAGSSTPAWMPDGGAMNPLYWQLAGWRRRRRYAGERRRQRRFHLQPGLWLRHDLSGRSPAPAARAGSRSGRQTTRSASWPPQRPSPSRSRAAPPWAAWMAP